MKNGRAILMLVAVGVLAAGCGSAATSTANPPATVGAVVTGSPIGEASSAARSPAAPSSVASASPAASADLAIATLTKGDVHLEPGTYRTQLVAGGGTFPGATFTVPAGWISHDGWAIHRENGDVIPVSMTFWHVGEVYGDPCHWKGTLLQPGPTVDDLATALAARPLRNATAPVASTLGDRDGTFLEWSVPADQDFTTCDVDNGQHYFESWTAPNGSGDRYQQGPGQVDDLWILDVGGDRLVVDTFHMPSATPEELAELKSVIASVKLGD